MGAAGGAPTAGAVAEVASVVSARGFVRASQPASAAMTAAQAIAGAT